MGRPTVGSLFSGIGGLDLGLERAGFEVRWMCEADPWCRSVLSRRWPGVPCYEDARALPSPLPERVDLIAGGFPCQPVSVLGKGGGIHDARWGWPWTLEWIKALRPIYVLLENVPGLLSARTGFLGDRVRVDLSRAGYYPDRWARIASGGLGAPHLRERVFLVAYSDEGRQPGVGAICDLGRKASKAGAKPPIWRRGRDSARYRLVCDRRGGAGFLWVPEPDIRRVDDGFPGKLDKSRLLSLGNAVCPPVGEVAGRELIKLF